MALTIASPAPPVLQSDTFEIQRQKINNLASAIQLTGLNLFTTPYVLIAINGSYPNSNFYVTRFTSGYNIANQVVPANDSWQTLPLTGLGIGSIPKGLYINVWNYDAQNGENPGCIQYRGGSDLPAIYTANVVGWVGSGSDNGKSHFGFVPVSKVNNSTYGSFDYYRTSSGGTPQVTAGNGTVNSWGISVLGYYV